MMRLEVIGAVLGLGALDGFFTHRFPWVFDLMGLLAAFLLMFSLGRRGKTDTADNTK
jgi:hypothetical protein